MDASRCRSSSRRTSSMMLSGRRWRRHSLLPRRDSVVSVQRDCKTIAETVGIAGRAQALSAHSIGVRHTDHNFAFQLTWHSPGAGHCRSPLVPPVTADARPQCQTLPSVPMHYIPGPNPDENALSARPHAPGGLQQPFRPAPLQQQQQQQRNPGHGCIVPAGPGVGGAPMHAQHAGQGVHPPRGGPHPPATVTFEALSLTAFCIRELRPGTNGQLARLSRTLSPIQTPRALPAARTRPRR